MSKEYKTYTVLVAEDEKEIRKLLVRELESITNIKTVISAVDGVDANNKIRNQVFDLVVMDYKLPKKTGLEIITELKKDLEKQGTKIILISGYLDPMALKQAIRLGIHKVMVKPFTDDEFMAEVSKLITLDLS